MNKETRELQKEINALKEQNEFLTNEHKRLLTEHRDLTDENSFLKRQNSALKFRASHDSKRLMELESEIADLRFTHKFLTSEEAGKRFAEELLGGA